MPALERPSAIKRQHLPLPWAERGKRVISVACSNQLRDEGGIDHRPAVSDPLQRRDEFLNVSDAALEEVADTSAAGQELHGVLDFDVGRGRRFRSRGCSFRICRAASRPSAVCVGGIRMSTTTSAGVFSRTSLSSSALSPAWPMISNPERSSRLAISLAQQNVVLGQDHGQAGHVSAITFRPEQAANTLIHRRDEIIGYEYGASELSCARRPNPPHAGGKRTACAGYRDRVCGAD